MVLGDGNGDACFAPVLSMTEAPHHPHNVARASFVEVDGVMQPAPAPRLSLTAARSPSMWDGEVCPTATFAPRPAGTGGHDR
jgi:crotonobetainyl-CoA:carnitine CoA-transferase CaiB-like acyl-CoA transferase